MVIIKIYVNPFIFLRHVDVEPIILDSEAVFGNVHPLNESSCYCQFSFIS